MKKIIFIGGSEQSGSSMMDLMLGNSHLGFSGGEIYNIFRPNKKKHNISNTDCVCKDLNCKFWSIIKNGGIRNVYKNIFNEKEGIKYIIDSSKNPLWYLDQMRFNRNRKYEIIPIIMFKTPFEFLYSKYKRNKLNVWDMNWKNVYKHYFYIFDKFSTVKYKELAKNPSEKLKSVCRKIGIDYLQNMENFWENKDVNHFLFGATSIRNPVKKIYYHEQYDNDISNFLINNNKLKDREFDKILKILNAYEINSLDKLNKNILELKDKVKEFTFFNFLFSKLSSTPYYRINYSVKNLKFLTIKTLSTFNKQHTLSFGF